MIILNNYWLVIISKSNKLQNLFFCLRGMYEIARFGHYFLSARAVLDIFFKFAPGMESGVMRVLFWIFPCSLNNNQDMLEQSCS